jgi:predicted component of type VI protein secretion system
VARLMLSLDGQILAEYNMNKERYTIGRLPDNDIRIDNPAVSGHHSLIINILNDSFLEDLNSTNGTYVNGKLIKKHAMQHGDVITVGHHQLRFVDSQDGDAEQDEFEKTMVITPSSQGEDRIRRVGAAVDQAAKAVAAKRPPTPAGAIPDNAAALPKAKLQVLSGAFAGRELELTKALTTLGRPGVQVAAITRRAEGYFIVHVDSGKENDYPHRPGGSTTTMSCSSRASRWGSSRADRRGLPESSQGPSPEPRARRLPRPQGVIPRRLNSSAMCGDSASARTMSACPSDTFFSRSSSMPRPYKLQGFCGLSFRDAS